MPFGLKNTGVTYQRAMTYIFHDLLHKTVEDYVDDLLGKSKHRQDNLFILAPLFERLICFCLRLNPAKYVFGILTGKILGFIISIRGIEVDPAKIKAILDMPPPSNLKELHSLQGHLQSVHRFISQLSDRCQPFHHLLRKNVHFEWDEHCQKAFDDLKAYLISPPVLTPLREGEPFYLYISMTDHALGAMISHRDTC
ncbi:hypothetical protein KI387_031364, partial [Taxus chinensis]